MGEAAIFSNVWILAQTYKTDEETKKNLIQAKKHNKSPETDPKTK